MVSIGYPATGHLIVNAFPAIAEIGSIGRTYGAPIYELQRFSQWPMLYKYHSTEIYHKYSIVRNAKLCLL